MPVCRWMLLHSACDGRHHRSSTICVSARATLERSPLRLFKAPHLCEGQLLSSGLTRNFYSLSRMLFSLLLSLLQLSTWFILLRGRLPAGFHAGLHDAHGLVPALQLHVHHRLSEFFHNSFLALMRSSYYRHMAVDTATSC